MSIVFFILLIGPLVFFHELGHYIAAKFFKVGVIRFSVGFGPKIFSFQRGETEWRIGALPLGGFVQMVGMNPGETEELGPENRDNALWAKPIWQRFIIVLAGPIANLILPLPIFIGFYMAEGERLPARAGTVMMDSPADEAGLESGDWIIAINGDEVTYFDELQDEIGASGGEDVELTVRRGDEQFTAVMRPEIVTVRDRWVGIRFEERFVIGVRVTLESPILDVDPSGPAGLVGLQTFDRVIEVDGRPVTNYLDLEERVRLSEGPIAVTVARPVPVGAVFGNMFPETVVEVTLTPEDRNGRPHAGWRSAEMVVYSVQPGSPAAEAGLRPGDRIVSMSERRYNVFRQLLSNLSSNQGVAHAIVFERDGLQMTTELTPVELDVTGELGQDLSQTFVGMRSLSTSLYYPHASESLTPVPMSFFERLGYGIGMGFEALFGFILGILVGVWQLVSGQVGLTNLGGPMMIFDIANRAGNAGVWPFLRIMALISINLGILNLLPIPGLDGGNLMLFTIEAIKRGPLTVRTRQIANYLGLAAILFLFLLVFKNDVERYWSNFADFFD